MTPSRKQLVVAFSVLFGLVAFAAFAAGVLWLIVRVVRDAWGG